jgi:asparagine synthetase B (glutamine-hydrolysing)
MSALFGKCTFSDASISPQELDAVRPLLAPYGPDAERILSHRSLAILLRSFDTVKESRREAQPLRLESGSILAWDGRLDNRGELIGAINGEVSLEDPDVSIVGAAY